VIYFFYDSICLLRIGLFEHAITRGVKHLVIFAMQTTGAEFLFASEIGRSGLSLDTGAVLIGEDNAALSTRLSGKDCGKRLKMSWILC
jgi:hypothetical protein